jgi:hypothetical protein
MSGGKSKVDPYYQKDPPKKKRPEKPEKVSRRKDILLSMRSLSRDYQV